MGANYFFFRGPGGGPGDCGKSHERETYTFPPDHTINVNVDRIN